MLDLALSGDVMGFERLHDFSVPLITVRIDGPYR